MVIKRERIRIGSKRREGEKKVMNLRTNESYFFCIISRNGVRRKRTKKRNLYFPNLNQ